MIYIFIQSNTCNGVLIHLAAGLYRPGSIKCIRKSGIWLKLVSLGMRRKKKVVRSRCDNNRSTRWCPSVRKSAPLPSAGCWLESLTYCWFVFIGFGAPIQPKMLLSMVGIEIDLVYKGKIVKISNLKLFLFEFFLDNHMPLLFFI